MRKIGIYRTAYPLASEAFITQQAAAMARYTPFFLVRTKCGPVDFEHIALSEGRAGRLRVLLFAGTHLALLLGSTVRLRELSLLHAHFGPDGVCVMPLARRLRIPLIVTFHGGDCTVARRSLLLSGKLYNYHFLLKEEKLKKEAALFLAVSGFLRRRLLDKGYPDRKVRTHYIGVDTERFKPAERVCDEPYILCVGRHVAVKGIDVLLRAFSRLAKNHRALSLLQVGEGPLTGTLHSLAHTLGIATRVRFLGAQPHDKIVELMRGARVFALPSQKAENGQSEALGIVFNEASACGIPVVATRHGGIPEAVLDGETGFLVAEKDDVALAERLEELLSDAALASRMGRRGREYVCEAFDLRKQTRLLERIYDEVAGQ
ncbi:MAG: glycosyltransferase [Spirochaetia bacterium]|jgi:glycosyltransferase involved in cell wall biosynthesis